MRERVQTGIKGLDGMLKGGIPAGNQIIVAGGPGTGKTLMSFEYLYKNALAGNICIFFSLEEDTRMIIENAKEAFKDMTEMERLMAEKKLIIHGSDQATSLVQKANKEVGTFVYTFTTTIADIESMIAETGATRVVVDSVSIMKLFTKDANEYRGLSGRLVSTLRKLGVTSILTMEIDTPEKEKLQFQPEFFIYDGIVIMYLSRGIDENRVPTVEIIKMRGTEHSFATVPYEITASGISMLLLPAQKEG